MPRIPTFNAQLAPSGTVAPVVGAAPDLSGLTGGITAAAGKMEALRQHEEEQAQQLAQNEARVAHATAVSSVSVWANEALEKAKSEAPAGAPGFTENFLKQFDAQAQSAVKGAPDLAHKALQISLAEMRTQMHAHAFNFEIHARESKLASDTVSGVQNDGRAVAGNEQLYNDKLAQWTATINNLSVPPQTKQKLLEDTRRQLSWDASEGFRLRNPGATVAAMDRYFGIDATAGAAPAPSSAQPGYAPTGADTRGIRNNNPGNIRVSADAWKGMVGNDGQYVRFATPEAGLRAMALNLQAYGARGVNTLSDIISTWAPKDDGNDVKAYISDVARQTGFNPSQPLNLKDPSTLTTLMSAMVAHENGRNPYAPSQFRAGVDAALGNADLPLPATPRALTAVDIGSMAANGDKSGPLSTFFAHLDPQHALEIRNQAVADLQRQQSSLRLDLEGRVKDFQAMVLAGVAPPPNTVPPPIEYARAFGPEAERRYQNDVVQYQRLGDGLRQLQGASYADRQAIIARYTPQPGAGFDQQQRMQDTLLKANQLMEKAIASDPASYAVQNSQQVRDAATAMNAVLGSATASADDRRAAVERYAQAALAEQQRLGITAIRSDEKGADGTPKSLGPRLLTNAQANAIAAQFGNQQQGGGTAATIIQGLEQQWGRYWPQVYQQLATDNKLPAAALVIPNMANDGSRDRLAMASQLKDDELRKLVASSDPKDIEAKLQSQFAKAAPSFLAQGGNGNHTVALVQDQAYKLALMYRAQGKSVSDAVSQAYTETMGWKYTFGDTYRVPKEQNPEAVQSGMSEVMKVIDKWPLQVFGDAGLPLTDEQRRQQTLDVLRTHSMFVTNGDESGVRLMVKGKDGTAYQVRDQNGNPLNFTWEQLRTMDQSARDRSSDTQLQDALAKGDKARVDQIERDRAMARRRQLYGW